MAYTREDIYDRETTEKIAAHYREILALLGEDPDARKYSNVYSH